MVAIHGVVDTDDLMIINKSGITIRLRVADLRVIGRATQGVRLIKINEGDEISSVAKIDVEDKAETVETIMDQSELTPDQSLDPGLTDELTDIDAISDN